jgi:hypothetical protein
MPGPRPVRSASALVALVALAGCAPREADFTISERARAAPPPALAPTARFEAPLAEGAESAGRLDAESAALAARASALRARAAALAGAAVLKQEDRARLAGAAGGENPPTP